LLAELIMPGFKKWEVSGPAAVPTVWVFLEELIKLVLPAVLIFAVAQGGRLLLGRRRASS
jgi:hypothetical protein